MSPKGSTENEDVEKVGAETGGVFEVKESGIQFRHMPGPSIPKDGNEFLQRVRYVTFEYE